ncbi:MAG TPA: superoxide dismutase [Patescibacteria group bacterium]|nr:superoxide dismutase [Patescibacteria group bacterium]
MFTLEALPYKENSFEPYMSEQTLRLHHGKHHQGYVDNLNKLIEDTEFAGLGLKEIIIKTYNKPEYQKIFNNAGQTYNHNIFWQSLNSDSKDREMSSLLLEKIQSSFGSLDDFYNSFKKSATSQFGSGWVWLVQGKNGLEIVNTSNANNPLPLNLKPLIVLDVWEHAYYLDYQNRRLDFVEAYLKQMVNWKFAEGNLE